MTASDKLELQVAEEKDGSAIVQLPPDEENPQNTKDADDDDDVGTNDASERSDDANDAPRHNFKTDMIYGRQTAKSFDHVTYFK